MNDPVRVALQELKTEGHTHLSDGTVVRMEDLRENSEKGELEERVYEALHQAFCRIRYFSMRPLNHAGKEHLFQVADAAHNLPDALKGDAYHRPNLERDLLALEALLAEPYGVASSQYVENSSAGISLLQRFKAAIGR